MEKAWVVAVSMGYGHQRTAYPLAYLAFERIINANNYEGIPERDKKTWENSRRFYEFISNFKRIPLVGEASFFIFNQFQKIFSFYPKRDLSKPNFAVKQIFSLIKNGWGRDLIEKFRKNPFPIISTFFPPAFMAEFSNYPGEIFCVVCDADISRSWASLNPKESKIKYFAPTERVVERLKLYGIKSENIFLTGYPLPKENIGTEEMEILKEDLGHRLLNLDSKKRYFKKYRDLIEKNLGQLPEKSNHILTIMFSMGGAGAQKEIGVRLLKSLAKKIKAREIKIILSAGTKEKIKSYFIRNVEGLGLKADLEESIEVLFAKKVEDYFRNFNQALRKTDILWTKPSELSFYSALGVPIIVAPPIGSQEEFNMRYLLKSGFGMLQENPEYAEQWLFDWLDDGYLAECAMEGFVEGEQLGTFKIEKIISRCSGS